MKKFLIHKSNYLILCTVVVFIFIFSIVALGRYISVNLSKEYLARAKKFTSKETVILDLEIATLLNPTDTNKQSTGQALVEYGDYKGAIKYFIGLSLDASKKSLALAYYQDSQYDQAINVASNFDKSDENMYLLHLKSLLAQGKIDDFRRLIEVKYFTNTEITKLGNLITSTSLDSLLSRYNDLKKLGFPQASFSILLEASKGELLTRDGYITLAEAQIQHGRSEDAYSSLKSALDKDRYYPQTYRQLTEVGKLLGKDTSEYENRLSLITWISGR